jgi:predicted class III extradiol MEMO1 family dioxygenase
MTMELLRYEQSSAAKNREDSSVSYVSAVVY